MRANLSHRNPSRICPRNHLRNELRNELRNVTREVAC